MCLRKEICAHHMPISRILFQSCTIHTNLCQSRAYQQNCVQDLCLSTEICAHYVSINRIRCPSCARHQNSGLMVNFTLFWILLSRTEFCHYSAPVFELSAEFCNSPRISSYNRMLFRILLKIQKHQWNFDRILLHFADIKIMWYSQWVQNSAVSQNYNTISAAWLTHKLY